MRLKRCNICGTEFEFRHKCRDPEKYRATPRYERYVYVDGGPPDPRSGGGLVRPPKLVRPGRKERPAGTGGWPPPDDLEGAGLRPPPMAEHEPSSPEPAGEPSPPPEPGPTYPIKATPLIRAGNILLDSYVVNVPQGVRDYLERHHVTLTPEQRAYLDYRRWFSAIPDDQLEELGEALEATGIFVTDNPWVAVALVGGAIYGPLVMSPEFGELRRARAELVAIAKEKGYKGGIHVGNLLGRLTGKKRAQEVAT